MKSHCLNWTRPKGFVTSCIVTPCKAITGISQLPLTTGLLPELHFCLCLIRHPCLSALDSPEQALYRWYVCTISPTCISRGRLTLFWSDSLSKVWSMLFTQHMDPFTQVQWWVIWNVAPPCPLYATCLTCCTTLHIFHSTSHAQYMLHCIACHTLLHYLHTSLPAPCCSLQDSWPCFVSCLKPLFLVRKGEIQRHPPFRVSLQLSLSLSLSLLGIGLCY